MGNIGSIAFRDDSKGEFFLNFLTYRGDIVKKEKS